MVRFCFSKTVFIATGLMARYWMNNTVQILPQIDLGLEQITRCMKCNSIFRNISEPLLMPEE